MCSGPGSIRHTIEHGQSIVAVTVTGSLEFPTLSSRRDADIIYRPSTLRDYCDTAWSLPLLCRTDGVAMDAAGFSIVDNRAGVTFGAELHVYVPWDAPEMATDLSAKGTVPLRDVQDVFGMCGRRKDATESRILQGRDARSVRVLETLATETHMQEMQQKTSHILHMDNYQPNQSNYMRPSNKSSETATAIKPQETIHTDYFCTTNKDNVLELQVIIPVQVHREGCDQHIIYGHQRSYCVEHHG